MVGNGYQRTKADHCVYFRKFSDGNFTILLLYVVDMLIVGQGEKFISRLKGELAQSFEVKDLGDASQILGMQIVRDRKSKKLWLSQQIVRDNKYIASDCDIHVIKITIECSRNALNTSISFNNHLLNHTHTEVWKLRTRK